MRKPYNYKKLTAIFENAHLKDTISIGDKQFDMMAKVLSIQEQLVAKLDGQEMSQEMQARYNEVMDNNMKAIGSSVFSTEQLKNIDPSDISRLGENIFSDPNTSSKILSIAKQHDIKDLLKINDTIMKTLERQHNQQYYIVKSYVQNLKNILNEVELGPEKTHIRNIISWGINVFIFGLILLFLGLVLKYKSTAYEAKMSEELEKKMQEPPPSAPLKKESYAYYGMEESPSDNGIVSWVWNSLKKFIEDIPMVMTAFFFCILGIGIISYGIILANNEGMNPKSAILMAWNGV